MTSKYKVFYHYYENCFATFVLLRKEQTHIDFTSKASIPDDFATVIKEEFLITIIQARESSLNSQFPPYLSKAQAAKYLGISTQTLTEWMLNPNLHYSKTSLLNQMLELNIAGYGNDVAADALQRPSRETGPWDD